MSWYRNDWLGWRCQCPWPAKASLCTVSSRAMATEWDRLQNKENILLCISWPLLCMNYLVLFTSLNTTNGIQTLFHPCGLNLKTVHPFKDKKVSGVHKTLLVFFCPCLFTGSLVLAYRQVIFSFHVSASIILNLTSHINSFIVFTDV